jgi:hypothetical protein
MQGLAAEIYQIAHGSDKITLIHDMFEIGRLNSMISLSVKNIRVNTMQTAYRIAAMLK